MELPEPLLEPDDAPLELPAPVDGATASLLPAPEPRLGADPVAPEPELGRTEPWPGVVGRCWVTVCPLLLREGGSATR